MDKPLSGIKVLDLTTFVAAPVCCRLLSDMGAEVIKVEPPKGDAWRETAKSYQPGILTDDVNPVFDIYNSGKKHVSINLKSPEGKEAILKMIDTADVFLTNTRPAGLKRLGLSYEEVKARRPDIIYAILLGYGEKGPEGGNPAFDSTAFWSKSGFLRDQSPLTNDYMPINPPFGVGDTMTGFLLMGEICAALYRRKCTGEGDYVSTTLFHNGVFCFGTMNLISQKPYGKQYPVNRLQFGVPGGLYCCSDDEWVYVGIVSMASAVPSMCEAIGLPELVNDPTLFDKDYTVVDTPRVYEYLKNAFLQHDSDYWLAKAKEYDFPLVRLNSYSNVLQDPQALANGFVEQVQFPNGNVGPMPSSPIEMASVGELKTVPCGLVGADTRKVLADLGYTDKQIEAMLAAGAAV